MDQIEIESAEQPLATSAGAAAQSAQEDKPATNLNPVAQAPSLNSPVSEIYSEDPDLWFFQVETTFIVNCGTTKKDKVTHPRSERPQSPTAPVQLRPG